MRSVGTAQHPGEHQSTETGAMGGPFGVIVNVAGNHSALKSILKPVKYFLQFLRREEVEEHEHIGLFAGLVANNRIPFAFQNAVQTHITAMLAVIGLPVQLLQLVISFKLTDNT